MLFNTIGIQVASAGLKEALRNLIRLSFRISGIKIAYPRAGQRIQASIPKGDDGYRCEIQGTLTRLKPGHEIWLLTQDITTGNVWPQDCGPVAYDRGQGTWSGLAFLSGKQRLRIIAVSAPPTSQMLFRYWSSAASHNSWKPLGGRPSECTIYDQVEIDVEITPSC